MSRRGQQCRTCHFAIKDVQNNGMLSCHEDSCRMFVVVMPSRNPLTNEQSIGPVPVSGWPEVLPEQWCGKWKLDEETAGVTRN